MHKLKLSGKINENFSSSLQLINFTYIFSLLKHSLLAWPKMVISTPTFAPGPYPPPISLFMFLTQIGTQTLMLKFCSQ